jgi:hypothetical protein
MTHVSRMYAVGCYAILITAFSTVVRADVAPPHGYAERCTLDETCPLGKECVLCPADFQDVNQHTSVCERNLGSLGFVKQCKSWGASVWTEVWCRPVTGALDASVTIVPLDGGSRPPSESAADHKVPVVQCHETSGCGSCSTLGGRRHDGPRVALGLLVPALTLFMLRRARSARRGRVMLASSAALRRPAKTPT